MPVDAWVFMTASLVVATETIGRQSSRLRHEAQTDSLTGLLNRKGLAPAAERAFALADRTEIPLTVALVDLDDFKTVNDRHGHAAGDRLLVQMTRTWSEELQPGDIFARLGGDEFLVISSARRRGGQAPLRAAPLHLARPLERRRDQAAERRGPERLPGQGRQHAL